MSFSSPLLATRVSLEAPQAPPRGALAGLTVYLDSLGCAKNLVDAEAMLGLLARSQCRPTQHPEDADLLLLNTCGFLEAARTESIDRILALAQLKTTARPRLLAVVGCLVSRAPEELREALPEVDVWLPAGHHGELAARLESALAGVPAAALRAASDRSGSGRAPQGAFTGFGSRILLGPVHSAYLKISEGCSNTCSFCSIPLMRGTQRSRPLGAIVEEAQHLAAGGTRELHLVAQDLTHYGFDLPGRPDLVDLCQGIAAVPGIEWIRLLYAHPSHLTERMLQELFEVPKVLPYLDMPIQHGSDDMLRAMRRPYRAARLRHQVRGLRDRVPGITLRTTVIVGFPGETVRDFEALCQLVADLRFDRLGVFAYSREPGTPAYHLGGRPRTSTVERRLHELTALQLHIAAERAAARVGQRERLLVDGRVADLETGEVAPIGSTARLVGRTSGEALDIDGAVFVDSDIDVPPGSFVDVEITAHDVFDLRARLVSAVAGDTGREPLDTVGRGVSN